MRCRSRALTSAMRSRSAAGPALRDPHGDLRSAARRQKLLEKLGVPMFDRQVHLGRQKRIGVVELRKERFQERDGLELLGFLEEEVPTVLQHSAAHDQDDDGDVLSRLEEAEHVDVLALERLDDLPLGDVRARSAAASRYAAAISKFSSSDEACIFASRRVSSSSLRPCEKEDDVGDRVGVRLPGRQPRDAGTEAGVQVVVEAGPRELAVDLERAGPDLEVPRDHPHDPAGQASPERPEVGVAVVQDPPRHESARPGLPRGDLDVGVGLVVPKADVVAGTVLLDERVLEEQGLELGAG